MLGKLSTRERGLLHASNSAGSGVPPLLVRGSATVPLVFHPDNRARNVTVEVVSKIPYGLVLGARFYRTYKSISDFGPGEGFKPEASAS